jgi:hypothetical protein
MYIGEHDPCERASFPNRSSILGAWSTMRTPDPVLCSIVLCCLPLSAQQTNAEPNSDTFRVSRLVCVIGNNAASGEHRAGYNGIFRMTSPELGESVYLPAVAGLNLEHYFDARPRSEDPKIFFEPRHAPMRFRKLSATKAELFQDPTPVYGVESSTEFELKEPYYVDIKYRATPRKDGFTGGFLGIFWASYINGPLDKSIYFLRDGSSMTAPQWAQFSTQMHGRDSTVRSASDKTDLIMGDDPTSLYRNVSPLRYSEPFYYGRFRDMVLIYIFKSNPYLRFAHSASGGGRAASGDDTNPAWDFQLVIPNPEVGREYGLEMRVVYKPWAGRADVLREVRSWQQ